MGAAKNSSALKHLVRTCASFVGRDSSPVGGLCLEHQHRSRLTHRGRIGCSSGNVAIWLRRVLYMFGPMGTVAPQQLLIKVWLMSLVGKIRDQYSPD